MTKELLSEVLGEKVTKIIKTQDDILYYNKKLPNGTKVKYNSINLHELAHKCKEWAFYKDRWISSTWADKSATVTWGEGKSKTFKHCGTEPEAIFKACGWILEQKER